MGLSCDCGFEEYDWFYRVENGERSACATSRCYGCRGQINIGDEVRLMWEYELDDEGDEINEKATGRLCPVCSGLYDSLLDHGFCLTAEWGFISEAMTVYREEYAPPPLKR